MWRYCAWCPVRTECFAESMRKRESWCVWGGLSHVVRTRWLKGGKDGGGGRHWKCEECGQPLDPLSMLDDKTLKLCPTHAGIERERLNPLTEEATL